VTAMVHLTRHSRESGNPRKPQGFRGSLVLRFRGGDDNLMPRGEAGRLIAERYAALARNRRPTPMAAPSSTYIPVCTAWTQHSRARAADARLRPRPNPRRQNLGLPGRRRHVRCNRHNHRVDRRGPKPTVFPVIDFHHCRSGSDRKCVFLKS
jgi:hypothetical protein